MAHRTVAVLVVAALAATARAAPSGRAPLTNGVALPPSDAHTLLVGSTFGLLISRDGGCSFRWVCEQALGTDGGFDPKYAMTPDGTLLATTVRGLRVSRDGGCTWGTATADLSGKGRGWIAEAWIDAVEVAPNGDVWVATADSGRANDVYRSTDGAHTFEPRGQRSTTIWWKSVKAAPSRAARVYITGYQVAGGPPRAHLLRSDDAGARWTASALAGVAFANTPILYALAVDPANPELVFVASLGAAPPAGDRLYRSIDGGATLREVLATTSTIKSVVHHGGAVLVAAVAGSYRSIDGGATFTALPGAPQLACLGARGGDLVGCGANWAPDDQAVARSSDGGATWDKLLRFVDLAGPLACAPGTPVAAQCAPRWPSVQQQFGATGPAAACPAPPPLKLPPPAPPARSGGGCCDGGGRGSLGATALIIGAVLVGGAASRSHSQSRRRGRSARR